MAKPRKPAPTPTAFDMTSRSGRAFHGLLVEMMNVVMRCEDSQDQVLHNYRVARALLHREIAGLAAGRQAGWPEPENN